MQSKKVFLASSSHTLQRGVLTPIVLALGERGYEPLPWHQAFAAGQITVQRLIDLANTCDFGVILLARDDVLGSTDSPSAGTTVTRDNVIFEAGMFVATLGLERVLLLEEEGVKTPSDLEGVTTAVFKRSAGETVLKAQLDDHIAQACRRWDKLSARTPHGHVDDGNVALSRTLGALLARLDAIVGRLKAYALRRDEPTARYDKQAVNLDSLEACVSAYCEALECVQERYWTTTFLSSGFWTDPERMNAIVAANTRMTNQLALKSQRPRRLFLIDQEPSEYADFERENITHLRRSNRVRDLARRSKKMNLLKQHLQRLRAEGCELKVVFDRNRVASTALNEQIPFDPYDSELAIYDSFRVDVFNGGGKGVINRITCYSSATLNFSEYLRASETFFKTLWKDAEDMDVFLERLERATEVALTRIDYEQNWLVAYEEGMNEQDRNLKEREMEAVKRILRGHAHPVRRYLDIGTCTARYPLALREIVAADGEILGIDDDSDCVQLASYKRASQAKDDVRIRILREDYTSVETEIEGPYDLITCMLGTLSHFGRDRRPDFDDVLQRVLRKTVKLLAPDGLLIMGTWSDIARDGNRLLSIYKQADVQRLVEWTPTAAELKKRLREAGLSSRREIFSDDRLIVWTCRKSSSPQSSVPPAGDTRQSVL